METNLRPLTLGEILDRTAQLYRTNFLLFAGIAAAYAGVVLLINLLTVLLMELFKASRFVSPVGWQLQIFSWGSLLVMLIVANVAGAANNRAVAWVHLGEPATIAAAYRGILPKVGRYLGLGTLKLLIAWLPVLLMYGVFLASYIHFQAKGVLPRPGQVPQPGATPNPETLMFGLITIGFAILIWPVLIYAVFMALRYALALPASVVENLKVRAAIKRSVALTKGARGRIFVLWLLVSVIEFMALAVTQAFFVAYSVRHHYQLPVGLRIAQQIVAFFTNSFVGPILAIGTTLFYYDQRVRKEGYDIEWMMAAAGLASNTPPVGSIGDANALPAEGHTAAGVPAVEDPQALQASTDALSPRGRRMTLQLRPANLGEILDRTAALYRSRFLVFVGIGAVPAGGLLFFAAGVFLLSARASQADPAVAAVMGVAILGLVLIAIPVCLGLTALGSGALSHASSQAFLGEPITIRGSYKAVWKRGWRYVGLLSLQILFLAIIPFTAWFVIVAGLAVLAAMSGGKGARVSADWASAPSLLLLGFGLALIVYFFWMLLRICLAFSACVVEQIGVWASLKRATALSKGTRGRILVLYLLCVALSWIVSLVLTVPIIIVLSLIPQMNTPQHQQTVGALYLFLVYGASFASQAFTKPVSGIAMMLFYYDQRIRKEAFDIEWMMREAGMVTEPAAPAEAAPWMPPIGSTATIETDTPPHAVDAQPKATGE